MSAPAELLSWDSEFFGLRIARAQDERLDQQRLVELDRWCAARAVDCLYVLAASDDRQALELVHQAGFRLVDVRITLARSTDDLTGVAWESGIVRRAHSGDIQHLGPIARRCHTDSRFYFDPGFPDERCDDLYERWLERSLDGWADAVLVAEHQNRPAGYITCHRGDGKIGLIGLLGVGAAARGKGLGSRLVVAALSWFAAEGLASVEVVTQGRNVAAQRLYQAAGFRTLRVGFWFHHWVGRRERLRPGL